jgi:uncharacterized membrane protein
LPPDLTPLDIAAFLWFVALWQGYTIVFDHALRGRPFGLNQRMKALRRDWMERMLQRDNRITDSALVGHTIHSVTFFASTTMLIIAGLLGVIGGIERAYGVMAEISFTVKTSKPLFELKTLALITLFIYAFFRFTWALRQYNYLCALIGGAPLPPVAEERRRRIADAMATVLTLAVTSFNGGLRAYYFALALLGWFVHPLLLVAFATAMMAILLRRQLLSRTFHAIEAADEEFRTGRLSW